MGFCTGLGLKIVFNARESLRDFVSNSNRAAAFLQLGKEIKAIKDAEQAITLKPDWAKGYFRKGAALVALRRCS